MTAHTIFEAETGLGLYVCNVRPPCLALEEKGDT
jgi:hypothetical protein